MTVPDAFVGAWVRESVQAAAEPAAEPSDVLWLQGREWFADLRAVRAGAASVGPVTAAVGARPEAFAGRCRHHVGEDGAPDALEWEHHVDWTGGFAGTDAAEVRWLGDRRFEERGLFDHGEAEVPYTEVWVGEPGPADVLVAVARDVLQERNCGVIVRVGVHRLVLVDERPVGGPFAVSHSRRDELGGWYSVRRTLDPTDRASRGLDAAEAVAAWLEERDQGPEVAESFAGSGMLRWTVMEARGAVHDDVPLSKRYRNNSSLRSPA